MSTTAWSPEVIIREIGDDGHPSFRRTPSSGGGGAYRAPSMDIRTVLDADTTEASTIGLNASHMLDESMTSPPTPIVMSTVRPSASAMKRREQHQHPYLSASPSAATSMLPKVTSLMGPSPAGGVVGGIPASGVRVLSLQASGVPTITATTTPQRESPISIRSRRGPHRVAPLHTPNTNNGPRNDFVEVNLSSVDQPQSTQNGDLQPPQHQQVTPYQKLVGNDTTTSGSRTRSDADGPSGSKSPSNECPQYPQRSSSSSPPQYDHIYSTVKSCRTTEHGDATTELSPIAPEDMSVVFPPPCSGGGGVTVYLNDVIVAAPSTHHTATATTSGTTHHHNHHHESDLKRQLALVQCRNKILSAELSATKDVLNNTSLCAGDREQECVELNQMVDSLNDQIGILRHTVECRDRRIADLEALVRQLTHKQQHQPRRAQHPQQPQQQSAEYEAAFGVNLQDEFRRAAAGYQNFDDIPCSPASKPPRSSAVPSPVGSAAVHSTSAPAITTTTAAAVDWEAEHRKLASLVVGLKVKVAQHCAILDRLGITEPFTEALVGTALLRLSRLEAC